MKISDHITYAEAIHSNTAKRKGIDNTPNPNQIEAMKLIAEKVFEPLREWAGGPIKVNSFFRSPELNTAIGGSKTSQHCKGQAIDIDDVYGCKTNAERGVSPFIYYPSQAIQSSSIALAAISPRSTDSVRI